ncbi:tail completion protein gp17 [Planctomycetes bacterium TBK1r]|uniref:DUF3168 domain-containing protein n=1 Tax=Stieleria magnilauensis TaxID=2527963 RepID=A0ABX5XZ76_9BACT|nr:hypothetical protein TBK1r_59460 [Planctomycetes bacterium TBK1r]QDV86997.1 hypothetical protein TBK1r_60240 [Planctomycetes bacterium TBK1r]
MADVGQSLRDLLLDDASVVAQVGSRVIPDSLAQGETLPAITYRVISTTHEHDINGPKVGLATARIAIECYASTRVAANALAELVRLSGILDWEGDDNGVDVRAIEIDSGAEYLSEQNSEGSHELRYITATDYSITYRETV